MTTFGKATIFSAFVQSTVSSYLPRVDTTLRALRPRSQGVEVSPVVESYMQDIAENITAWIGQYQPTGSGLRDVTSVTERSLPFIVERVPVPTATVCQIPNDPPPRGTEWDESIANDPIAIAAVRTAWNEAIRLRDLANGGLNNLEADLNKANLGSNVDKKKDFIAKQSPPFAQQFGSDPDIIPQVKKVFQDLVDRIEAVNAGGRGGNVLRLGLGANVKAMDGRSKICGAKNKDIIYAATYAGLPIGQNNNDLQKKYLLEDSIIFFCNGFFQHLKDPEQLTADVDVLNQQLSLDKLRTPGQTILHEWTHLIWIKHTNANKPPDSEIYGFTETAELAKNPNKGNVQAMNNADNYAVFASYHAYNQEPWAPVNTAQGFGCRDVWPRASGKLDVFDPIKPGKDTWP